MAKSKFLFAYINNLPSNICLKEKSKKKLLKISNHYYKFLPFQLPEEG